jgi:sulfate adenylyltransferase
VSRADGERFKTGQEIALMGPAGLMAVLYLKDQYEPDQKNEARKVYRTEEEAHPGVAAVYQGGPIYLGGPITMVKRPTGLPFAEYRNDPAATRAHFQKMNWKTVVAFQTRNPIHRAHEYLQKCAMELVDGLMIHPLVGETKSDDIPAAVRMDCYKALLSNYYPKDRVFLSVFPANMRYAGPREAILHAIVRKNYGCTHIIIGRDHAGVGSYYGSYDAQHIFREFEAAALGITPMFFENSFFCRACGAMASQKTCPHPADQQVALSGTKVREMLASGQRPPAEFSRAEVADILIAHYRK